MLRPSGELAIGRDTTTVYQCDECFMTVDMMGSSEEVALTFALDPDGKPFDPASPDGTLRF